MHIRHRDLTSFIGDAGRFYSVGLLDEGVVHLCRNHLQLKKYRREASKQQALAGLIGSPSDWAL